MDKNEKKRFFIVLLSLVFIMSLAFMTISCDDGDGDGDDDPNDTIPNDTIPADTIRPDSTGAGELEYLTTLDLEYAWTEGLLVVDNYLYISESRHIGIYDISNPASPSFVGEYPDRDVQDYVTCLTREGDILAFTYKDGSSTFLQLANIADRAAPVLLGEIELEQANVSVRIKGDYAYVTANNVGIHIVDISDPSDPQFVTTKSISLGSQSIEIYNNNLYSCCFSSGITRKFSLSTPGDISESGQYFAETQYAEDVDVEWGYVYTANGVLIPPSNSGLFSIFDENTGTVVFTDTLNNESCKCVDVDGNYAYVLFVDHFNVYGVYHPENPVLHFSEEFNTTTRPGNNIYVKDNIIYITYGTTLKIYRHSY